MFQDDSLNFDYKLQEIIMDKENVEISSSNKSETAWKLIEKNSDEEGVNNNWQVEDFPNVKSNTYVVFDFKSPILIRGYAIRNSGNDEGNDPVSFEVRVLDYMKYGDVLPD